MEKAPLVGGAFALGLVRFVLACRHLPSRRLRLALRASSLTVAVGVEKLLPNNGDEFLKETSAGVAVFVFSNRKR